MSLLVCVHGASPLCTEATSEVRCLKQPHLRCRSLASRRQAEREENSGAHKAQGSYQPAHRPTPFRWYRASTAGVQMAKSLITSGCRRMSSAPFFFGCLSTSEGQATPRKNITVGSSCMWGHGQRYAVIHQVAGAGCAFMHGCRLGLASGPQTQVTPQNLVPDPFGGQAYGTQRSGNEVDPSAVTSARFDPMPIGSPLLNHARNARLPTGWFGGFVCAGTQTGQTTASNSELRGCFELSLWQP